MQRPTRVSIAAESQAEARKLKQVFEDGSGFVVTDVTTTGIATEPDRGRFDVRVVQVDELPYAATEAQSAPTLYIVSEESTRSLDNGSGVLPSDATPAQIRAAAMALAAGLQIAPRRSWEAADRDAEFGFMEPLTERELHILNLVADGLSNPEIARRLEISRNTVKFHVSSIIAKLGAASRTEAVTIGLKRGLIIL